MKGEVFGSLLSIGRCIATGTLQRPKTLESSPVPLCNLKYRTSRYFRVVEKTSPVVLYGCDTWSLTLR